MKIGLVPVNVGVKSVEQMVGLAQFAESIGVESAWTFEHAMVPQDYSSKYPYSQDGKMGANPETSFIDPLIALSVVAANTKTLRLGTGVNIVAQANPREQRGRHAAVRLLAPQARAQRHIVECAKPRQQKILLRHIGNAPGERPTVAGGDARLGTR